MEYDVKNDSRTNSESKMRFITYTSNTFWPITRPRATEQASIISAQNQIASSMLSAMGVTLPVEDFRTGLERNYPFVLAATAEFIGPTIPVMVPADMTPRQFRKQFCEKHVYGPPISAWVIDSRNVVEEGRGNVE